MDYSSTTALLIEKLQQEITQLKEQLLLKEEEIAKFKNKTDHKKQLKKIANRKYYDKYRRKRE